MRRMVACAALALVVAGCANSTPYDYGPYLEHMPRSILVLPPTNSSVEPLAPYNYLSTATAPLAELGYYVFPVAMIDSMLKENGLPTPAEMHSADLSKLQQIIGADAVLYLHVNDWGTSYQVLNSQTTVSVSGRLVDARTGIEIWSGSHVAVHNSSDGQNNVIGMLVVGLISQIASTASDHAHDLAGPSAGTWWNAPNGGLLLGERNAGFASQQQRLRSAGPN